MSLNHSDSVHAGSFHRVIYTFFASEIDRKIKVIITYIQTIAGRQPKINETGYIDQFAPICGGIVQYVAVLKD